jgi:hypothetical protein
MSFYRIGDIGLALGTGPRQITFPTTLTPVPLSAKLVASGHSILDYWLKWPWQGVIEDSGATANIVAATGAYASAKARWDNDYAGPDTVRALMEEPSAAYDLFLGIEAHGGSYGSPGRASVKTNTDAYDPPTPGDAYVYALLWHNLAASTGAQTFYANFWRDDTAETFGSSWRAAQNDEIPLWESIIDYVNANKDPDTPTMRLVPFLEVFCAIYDAIQASTLTGMTMPDFFVDNVHPSDLGMFVQMATVMAVMYQRHPDQMPNTASAEFEFLPDFTVDSGLAAQLRPLIWSTCLANSRTGLGA